MIIVASEPPLIPISDDARPTIKPQPVIPARPGRLRPSTQLSRPARSLAAMMPAMTTKASLNTCAGANAAATDPAATPITAGKAQERITAGMTMPLARCARYDGGRHDDRKGGSDA